MAPELGQAIETDTNGQGTAVAVVEVNSAGTACAVRIEFNAILTETNPVISPCIDLGFVRPALRSALLIRIGVEMHTRKGLQIQYHLTLLQKFLASVSVAIPPKNTVF